MKDAHINYTWNSRSTVTDTEFQQGVNAFFSDLTSVVEDADDSWKDEDSEVYYLSRTRDTRVKELSAGEAALQHLKVLAEFIKKTEMLSEEPELDKAVDQMLGRAYKLVTRLVNGLKNLLSDERDVFAVGKAKQTGKKLADGNDSDESEFVAHVRKPKKRSKNRQRSAKKRVLPLETPSLAIDADDLAYLDSDDKEVEEDWRFPATAYKISHFKVAQVNYPMLNGKRVAYHKVKPEDRAKVQWECFAPETFYAYTDCDIRLLDAFCEEGAIPSAILNDMKIKQIATAGLEKEPIGIPGTEVAKKLSHEHITTADIVFYWAAAEKVLRVNDHQHKIPHLNKWMVRLLTMPNELSGGTPIAARKLFMTLKHAGSETAKVNKAFRYFCNGMLASWPAGKTRTAYLAKSAKSLEVYWGPYATNYKDHWCAQVWNPDSTKPAKNSIMGRMFNKVSNAATTIVKETKSALASSTSLAVETAAVVVESAKAIDEATHTMTTWEKARAYASFAGGSAHKYYRSFFDSEKVEIGNETFSFNTTLNERLTNIIRLTIGFPFLKLDEQTVRNKETNEVVVLKGVVRRPWFESFWQGVLNFGAPADNDLADASDAPGPFRFTLRAWSGLYSSVKHGIQRGLAHAGGYWSGDDLEDTQKWIDANVPKPAYGRFLKGIGMNMVYSITGGATLLLTGVNPLIGGVAWMAGWIAGESAANWLTKWRRTPKKPSVPELPKTARTEQSLPDPEAHASTRSASASPEPITVQDNRTGFEAAIAASTDLQSA